MMSTEKIKKPRLVSRSNPGCIDMIQDNLNTINILRRCPDHSFTEDAENWTGSSLKEGCAQQVMDAFGPERLAFVLATVIR